MKHLDGEPESVTEFEALERLCQHIPKPTKDKKISGGWINAKSLAAKSQIECESSRLAHRLPLGPLAAKEPLILANKPSSRSVAFLVRNSPTNRRIALPCARMSASRATNSTFGLRELLGPLETNAGRLLRSERELATSRCSNSTLARMCAERYSSCACPNT